MDRETRGRIGNALSCLHAEKGETPGSGTVSVPFFVLLASEYFCASFSKRVLKDAGLWQNQLKKQQRRS